MSGTVAAVDGSTLQVQDSSSQTAVVYTGKTTVTARVTTTASALAVGDCVSVRTAATASTASAGPTAANAGTGELAASTVTILSSEGGCTDVAGGGDGGGFPGGGAGRPSGAPSGMPSGAPSGMPTDRPSGAPTGGPPRGGGFGTTGEITTLVAGTFTVTPRAPGAGGSTAGPTASATPTPVTVTYADDTTFLTTAKATAGSIEVGSCVRATGTTDDTGTLTATTLVISQPVDGACTTGVRGG